MRITKHTKAIGIVALVVFTVSLGLLGGILWLIQETETNLNSRQIEVAKMQTRSQELNALTRLVDESSEERALLESYVLSEEEVIDFLSLIELLAGEQGVEVEISNLRVVEVDAVFEELQLEVMVTGSDDEVAHTLLLLESLPHQAHVSSVSLRSTGGTRVGNYTLKVTKIKDPV